MYSGYPLIEKEKKREWNLHIAIAPTKNADRIEWFLEKATEIGIDAITPLVTEHSERTRINSDRLKRILVSAMKQSLKYTLPRLEDAVSFKEFISRKQDYQKFIAYCETGKEEDIIFKYKRGSDVVIMIGPEGDFSAEEVRKAAEAGYEAVSLGTSRLRTETAGVVACQVIHTLNSIR